MPAFIGALSNRFGSFESEAVEIEFGLVSALRTLPGYDQEKAVAAIEDQGCCDNKVVTVWSAE